MQTSYLTSSTNLEL